MSIVARLDLKGKFRFALAKVHIKVGVNLTGTPLKLKISSIKSILCFEIENRFSTKMQVFWLRYVS